MTNDDKVKLANEILAQCEPPNEDYFYLNNEDDIVALVAIVSEWLQFTQPAITISSPTYYEDNEWCGYCHRLPGSKHSAGCRQ
jgi:hypothetical protein